MDPYLDIVREESDPGFPAHAGMDPIRIFLECYARLGFPAHAGMDPTPVSPPMAPTGGFPAHAGMDLFGSSRPFCLSGLPRTRGDGPSSAAWMTVAIRASPHTRGWTLPLAFTGPLPRTGFPAHAGMDPGRLRRADRGRRLPRTRGDGPDATIRLRRLGRARLPRTRGDGPVIELPAAVSRGHGLPRTRGDGPVVAS